MLIAGGNGRAVNLQPLRWQFPPDAGDWDDRWLVITGKVDLEQSSWSFIDPCLLIEEARELAEWLRAATEGRIEPDPPSTGQVPVPPSLSFMEPTLAFSVAARDDSNLVVRIHFAGVGAPPWPPADDPHLGSSIVELVTPHDQLLAAAAGWTQELNALPIRSWVDPG
jgi:hypothetical protein